MAVREGLLALMSEGPRYGYQLKTEFEAATGGIWTINVGQVYTTLDRLSRDGLVDVDQHEEQKRYSITLAGTEELGAWWQTVPVDEPPPRDELVLKVLMAIELGAKRGLDVVTKHRTALTTLLQRRRREAEKLIANAAGTNSNRSGEALASILVADALIVRAEADLRWLDLCESRLLKARAKSNNPAKPASRK